jgi:hypothetical protein
MNFHDYRWFNNPRGLRNNGPYTPLDVGRYTGPKMGWAKLVVGGSEHLDTVKTLLARNCMPILQIYRERMGAASADEAWYALYQQYAEAGALWFELYDEPNADHFWPLGKDAESHPAPDWHNGEACIAPVMDHWLDWAERIVALGAYPAFPAMAETTVPAQATVAWLDACLGYLAEAQAGRFRALIGGGLWCAVHPFVLNHFYQEPPGGPPTSARPYYQQTSREGGWHFEYPYDPLQQKDDPGRSPFGGTAKAPDGDPNGLVASGQVFIELLKKHFAAGPVPVVGTAGGISPIPAPDAEPIQLDTRYYGYSRDSHAEATLAMYRWIVEQGPPWFFGLALSTEADYYSPSAAPAIELMKNDPPLMKFVHDIETAGGAPEPVAEPAFTPTPALPRDTGEGVQTPVPGERTGGGEDIPAPTTMWPAPTGFEEVHTPEPVAQPDVAIPMPEPAPQPVPPLAEDIPTLTTMWPAPTGFEEVHTPEPVAQPAPQPDEPQSTTVATLELPAPEPSTPAPQLNTGPVASPELLAAPPPGPIPLPGPAAVATLDLPKSPYGSRPPAASAPATVATMEIPEPRYGGKPPAPTEKLGPGPGPVGEQAAYHWLMPAPDLPPGFWFGAARRYWDIFRLPVVADPALIGAIPADKSLAITLLASSAGAEAARARIAADWPNVRIDLVAADSADGLQAELDRRAHDRQEYG